VSKKNKGGGNMKLWMVWLIGFLFTWGYWVQNEYNTTHQFEFPAWSHTIGIGIFWPFLLGAEANRVVNHFVSTSEDIEDAEEIEDNGSK
jgi:hypothetical protein